MAIQHLLIIVSGFLCFIAFPSVNAFWLQLVSLIPLLYVLDRYYIYVFTTAYLTQLKRFSLIGFVFGIVYMGLTNIWVFELIEFSTPVTMIILFIIYTAFEALFFAFITLCYRFCHCKPILLPFIWILFEWLKSIGPYGSPNGVLGYSQANNVLINHFASLGGIYLVSFICVFVNVLIFLGIRSIKQSHHRRSFLYLFIIILILFSSYFYHLSPSSSPQSLSVASVQANHPMPYKFKRKNRPRIRQDYVSMSQDALKKHRPQLIIWPETITASLNLNIKSLMSPIKRMTLSDTAFIFGSPRKDTNHYYNTAVFITSQNRMTYDKIQLMPFGEYWPLKRVFQFFKLDNIIPGSEFTHGSSPKLFKLGSIHLAPIICLESTNSRLSRTYANQGADILISLVNNAWFKGSSIAARQLQMLQFRSIEVGLPSIQSANMGFSCFINASGQTTGILDKYQQDYVFQNMDCVSIDTPFRTWGNGIVLIAFVVILACVLHGYFQRG
tara:strand:- start:863 stop:2356 length:1494 start_codon:yes stop_codon:yes gene_type:complete